MTEEYRISQAPVFSQHFEIRGFLINLIAAPQHADPRLGRYPSILLYDNDKCIPAGRISGVAYFHAAPETLGAPAFLDNVISLHFPLELFASTVELLRSPGVYSCYFRGGGNGPYGGIQGALPRPSLGDDS